MANLVVNEDLRPAESLEGLELEGGWHVIEKHKPAPGATGSAFSTGYIVRNEDGTEAFLKAIDYSTAFREDDVPGALKALTEAFVFERDLLKKCDSAKLANVVHAIDDGKVEIASAPIPTVNYLIFERAEGDVRKFKDFDDRFNSAWALRALHNVANGLRQLHGQGVAHQDIKPSNALTFEDGTTKIADLGCASYRGHTAPRDHLMVPGDPAYAPPELLYGYRGQDWQSHSQACDAYHLGSLGMFLFASTTMTAAILAGLAAEHHPLTWGGTYETVLPYVRDAFDGALDEFETSLDAAYRERLAVRIRELCDPDPGVRGHPKTRASIGSSYSLERFVAEFDLLARRAEIELAAGMRA